MIVVAILFSLFTSLPANAVEFTIESQLKKLVPHSTIAVMAEGDLNYDDLNDFAMILVTAPPNDKRTISLYIYYGDGRRKLTLRSEIPKAVCFSCGGIKGGEVPFKLAIKDKILSVTQFGGGTRDEFEVTTKWNHRKFDFSFIGFTQKLIDATAEVGDISLIERDVDILNNTMVEKVLTVATKPKEGEKTTTEKILECPVPKTYNPMRLRNFDLEKFEVTKCSDVKL